MIDDKPTKLPRGSRWCSIGSFLAGFGILLVVVGPITARLGMLSPIGAFSAFGMGLLLILLSLFVLAIGLLLSKGSGGDVAAGRAWGSLIAGAVVLVPLLASYPSGEPAPAIHDLTTDVSDPPQFAAIVAVREADNAQNPPEYAGEETAQLQQAAFPDLQTLQLNASPDAVFAAAEQVVAELGWEVVAADPAAGLVEATDTTRWFRFKDDVVIRVRASAGGTEVDVRSKSRVGRGDMGANAARIRLFLEQLQAAVS